MRVSTIWVAVAAVLLAACGDDASEAPPPPPPREMATAGSTHPSPGPAVRFEVEDATIAEAVRSLAASTGTAVVIDPNAQAVANCARITVVTAGPRPPSELFDLMGEALSSASVTLDRRPEGVILRRERATPLPDSCSPQRIARPPRPTLDLPSILRGGETGSSEARAQALETLREGVRATSDTEYLITEEAAGALADGGLTARSARIVPHMEGGRIIGMKLYGIRRNSALAVLGFQNGDTIRSLAGHDISSPEQALEAYSLLRGRDEVTVSIERRGQPVDLRYRVVARLPRR